MHISFCFDVAQIIANVKYIVLIKEFNSDRKNDLNIMNYSD